MDKIEWMLINAKRRHIKMLKKLLSFQKVNKKSNIQFDYYFAAMMEVIGQRIFNHAGKVVTDAPGGALE